MYMIILVIIQNYSLTSQYLYNFVYLSLLFILLGTIYQLYVGLLILILNGV